MAAATNAEQLARLFRKAAAAHQQKRFREAQAGYEKILKRVPEHFDVLHLLGQSLIQDGRPAQAVRWLRRAIQIKPDSADACYDLGLAYRKSGQNEQAAHAYYRALEIQPDRLEAHLSLVEMKFPGDHYTLILRQLHQRLKPATYLEIGVETGQSMALAEPATRCIGIDPAPCVTHTLPPRCDIFAQTSDSFFEQFDVCELLGHQAIDFAFIDGMHVFEAALRDFMHVEQHARQQSVIAIHDCIPLDAVTSSRQRSTNFWSGDIWKLILCLKKYRPDLAIVNVAAKPTGLGLVTGLDPANRTLQECYAQIVEEYVPLSYDAFADQERHALNVIANDMNLVLDWLQDTRGQIVRQCASSHS
jgi:predicted O-methyltransferase YrrM